MKTTPPNLPLRFFRWFCHRELRDAIEGDLVELYGERVEEIGKRKADWRFAWDVLLLFRPGIVRNMEVYQPQTNYSMYRSYFKIGWRNILKYKAFSFINVFGLALAMSVGMLIILMLADQKSYDQFHDKKERTFRVLSKIERSMTPNASSPFPLAEAMKESYPIIEESTQLFPGVGGDANYHQKSVEMRGYFADASFFEVFGFELESGNKSMALSNPNSMVISGEMARQLFDREDPIGQTLQFTDRGLRIIKIDFGSDTGSSPEDWGSYTITGVIESKKYKSHLKFDVLISTASLPSLYKDGKVADHSEDWKSYSKSYNYILLKPGTTEQELSASLEDLVQRKYSGFEDLKGFRLIPQKLTEISPGIFVGNPSSLQLPIEVYYVLGLLALVIMISACVNYTNLSIARSLTRAKEIGVRKVSGAKRKHLVLQFLSESVINALLSLILAGILLILVKHGFKNLWVNHFLSFDLDGNVSVYLIFFGIAILVGLFAGIFPAVQLSGYSPVQALKFLRSETPGKLGVRKILSTTQFVVSLFFIITSILIGRQFNHYLEFEYGFDSENIINIPLQGNDYQIFSFELSKVPGVTSVSACEFIPAVAMTNGTGIRKADDEGEFIKSEHLHVDANFVDNLGLKIVAGVGLPQDSERHVIVNETAALALGYEFPSEIVGQILDVGAYENPVEVIGVMKDFRFQTPVMEDKIGPLVFRNQPEHFSYLNVKVASTDLKNTLSNLEKKWGSIDSVHPFKYQFFDDQLTTVNQWLGDLVSVIGFIAFIAIIIACLGMLGMAIYTTERRTKEVGIRKAFGAAEASIAILLSRQFIKLLLVSVFISAPLSYFINNLWLQSFPNRVEFGLGTLILGSGILLVMGLLTIGSQTILASKRNPVESLKAE